MREGFSLCRGKQLPADVLHMRTREQVRQTGDNLTMKLKKRLFTRKGWRKTFKKVKKNVKKIQIKISSTSNIVLAVYGVLILGILLILSSIIAISIPEAEKEINKATPRAAPPRSEIVDYKDNNKEYVHKDPGLATVAWQYKPVRKSDNVTVDPEIKESLKYPEISTVTLLSGLTLPVPNTWTPVASAGTDLAFSRNSENVVISFSDLGSLKTISEGVLNSVKSNLETQGSVLTPFKTSDKGVISFTAAQGDRQNEVYLMIVSGRGLMVMLTYDGKANSASSEVAWLVDTIAK